MRKDVEEALKKYQVKTFGNKKNIERAESKLRNDEKVLLVLPSNVNITSVNIRKRETLPGVFILTDKRILFIFKVLLSENMEAATLDAINSINCSGNGLTGGHIQIHTITKSYDILVSYKKNIMEMIQDTFLSAKETYDNNLRVGASSSTSDTDIIAQIEKLSQLKDKSILSEEEFETKKAELLSRL